MALVELCDGLSNEACVELEEINWFVLQRLRILFAAPCCPSPDLRGGERRRQKNKIKPKTKVHKGRRGRGQEGMKEGRGLFKQKILNWSGMSHATCSYRAFTFHFCGEFYTCKVNLACAIYPSRGRKRGEMCVAPQLPHVVKRVGKKTQR